MARVLLLTEGTYGDVFPFIALGTALQKRGHVVTLISNEHYRKDAHTVGLGFAATGEEKRFLEINSNPDSLKPRKAYQLVLPFMRNVTRAGYEAIEQLNSPGDTVTVELNDISA